MREKKTRVAFNAPRSLVDRVVEILDISRTRLLIDTLEDELGSLANDEGFRRRLSDAYYDGRVDYDTVEMLLGREGAIRMKLLGASIDGTPAEPKLTEESPQIGRCSGGFQIVAPLAEDFCNEFGIALCDNHRGLPVIGLVDILAKEFFEGIL